jgi:formylglycine-generating enzyme required for sulfatase activity
MKRTFFFLLFVSLLTVGCASSTVEATPPPQIETGVDPDSWALIPAGDFLANFNNEVVMVDYDYQMMVTDVTNAQYARFLNEALKAGDIKIVGDEIVGPYPGDIFREYRHEEEYAAGDYPLVPLAEEGLRLNFDSTTYTAKPGYENHPMVMVTWFGARAYCEFYDLRLPSAVEWEKAARGTDGRPYPWGDEAQQTNANYYHSKDPFEDVIGRMGDTTPVGFYNGQTHLGFETENSPSPYGLYDMAGNVYQWVGDVIPYQHYRLLLGGAKDVYAIRIRTWSSNNAEPVYFSPNAGFRCAQD